MFFDGLETSRSLIMRFFQTLLFLLSAAYAAVAASDGQTTEVSVDAGSLKLLTNSEPQFKVTWDTFSLMVNNERVYIFSGEFHYERLPNPEMWRDVFEKYKANG